MFETDIEPVILFLKTLKCCCTSRDPLAVLTSCDVVPRRHMTSRHHAMTSHNVMTSHHRPLLGTCSLKSENSGNDVFDLGDLEL